METVQTRVDPRDSSGLDMPELQETLLGQAFEHGPVGAIVLDEQGRFLAANRRAIEVCGYSRAELLALGSFGLCAEPGVADRLAAMAAGELTGGVERLRCKDGSVKDVRFRLGETTVSGLPFFVALFWEADAA